MKKVSKFQLINACLGNLFEHYDTALFGFLSPFLAPLIFPQQDPITALILTYAILPLGMLLKPVGALVFGHIGDVYGRQRALFLTLAGMSVVSGAIAFLPTYAQAGLLSPLLFFFSRALQNFFAAGETMGGAIFLLENSSEKHHDFLSSIYCTSTMGGHLLASFAVYILSSYQVIDSGWRLLYLFGCITAIFGCFMRFSPAPVAVPKKISDTFADYKTVFWKYRKPFFFILLTSGFASANYSISLVLMNGFVPLVTSITKTEIMKINTYLLIFDFLALPFFGWVASKIAREKVMLAASMGVVLFAIPLLISLEGASIIGVIGIRAALVAFGVAFFAPFHAWAQTIIPSQHRYVIISLGYSMGYQLLGSPSASLSLWLYQKTGMVSSIAWYWMALAFASTLSIIYARNTQEKLVEQAH